MTGTVAFAILFMLNFFLISPEDNIPKEPDFLDLIVGVKDLQIGYDENCYLFSNSEFRCNEDKGDPIELALAEEPLIDAKYILRSNGRNLTRGPYELNMEAEFKKDSKGIPLYIRRQESGLFRIGSRREFNDGTVEDCPMYRHTVSGKTVFNCKQSGKHVDYFIKTSSCVAKKIEVLPSAAVAIEDGEEIVGIVSSASCDKSEQTLQIAHTREVTNEIGLEITESEETNWEASGSVSVAASGKVFGVGMEVTVAASYAQGGSKGYSSSESESTSTGVSNTGGVEVSYQAPGGGMIIGLVKRYKYENSKTPARVTIQCKGHRFQYDTEIKLQSKTYSHTQFKSYTTEIVKEKCTQGIVECLFQLRFDSYASLQSAEDKFNSCFPPGSEVPDKRKRKMLKVKKRKENRSKKHKLTKSKNKKTRS